MIMDFIFSNLYHLEFHLYNIYYNMVNLYDNFVHQFI